MQDLVFVRQGVLLRRRDMSPGRVSGVLNSEHGDVWPRNTPAWVSPCPVSVLAFNKYLRGALVAQLTGQPCSTGRWGACRERTGRHLALGKLCHDAVEDVVQRDVVGLVQQTDGSCSENVQLQLVTFGSEVRSEARRRICAGCCADQ